MSRFWIYAAIVSTLLCACDSGTTVNPDRPSGLDLGTTEARPPSETSVTNPDKGGPTEAGSIKPDLTCPAFPGCTGLCGNITDKCTGQVQKCGGCPTGEVCNLETHTCTKALITCQQLGAECGVAKNSCGLHIDCGTCPDGKECDPDTNSCAPCKQVTCQDLGYECGTAWLGCGATTNVTSCGTCATGKKCNQAYNLCEPACTPGAAADICAAAKIASGVECGYISDGCGGVVNCGGCPVGKGCGIFGVANRCETLPLPDECAVLGKNCGTIASACGGTVDCGKCTAPQICNSNNVCGPACTPKKCTDFAPAECGVFQDGCNGMLTCTCASGSVCTAQKTCCKPPTCPAGVCNTTITNPCTGAAISCNTCNPSTQVCNTALKQCVPKQTCASLGAGGTFAKCNDFAFYDQGNGVKIACPCLSSQGWFCINDSATQEGTCCKNINPTCPTSGPGSCNSSVVNSCTGQVTQCVCPPGYHCEGDTCVANGTCAAFGAIGTTGAPCSNGPAFDNGNGQFLSCPCYGGRVCVDGSGNIVSGSTKGTCMALKTCADYSANGNAGDICSNFPSSAFPTGVTGGKLKCACSSAFVCADNQDKLVTGDATGVCKLKKTCADYGAAAGTVGTPCNDNAVYSDGFGGLFACPCKMLGGWGNIKCEGDSPTQAGTCACVATACTCANSGLTNGCGGTLSCPCPTGQTCNKATATCCQSYSCASLPPGIPAGSCGAIPNACLGTSFTCQCDTSTKPNNKCSIPSGQTYGSCVCVPKTCAELGVGTWPNDGCGNPITCTG